MKKPSRTRPVILLTIYLVASGILFIAGLHAYWSRFIPSAYRAEAARWALTTAWLETAHYRRTGRYVSCGPPLPPCWIVLGPLDRPEIIHRKGAVLRVKAHGSTYEIKADLENGQWRLSPDSPLRWIGHDPSIPPPRGRRINPYIHWTPGAPDQNDEERSPSL